MGKKERKKAKDAAKNAKKAAAVAASIADTSSSVPTVARDTGLLSEREILQEELARLCTLQNKYIENEEYEKAEILKNRIIKLQNKIDKL